MDELVTIRTYDLSELAHLDLAKLADEGIEGTLHDETLASMMPHLSGAIGGVKLLVRGDEAERALGILEASVRSEPQLEVPEAERTDRCPKCGSTEYSKKSSLFSFLAALIFGLSAAAGLKRRECAQCGHSWL